MAARTLDSPNGAVVSLHGRKLYLIGDDTSQALFLNSTAGGRVIASTRGGIETVVAGVAAAGPITLTGAKVGDLVKTVINLSTPANASASFESTISVADQLQQTSGSDLSGSKYLVSTIPQS